MASVIEQALRDPGFRHLKLLAFELESVKRVKPAVPAEDEAQAKASGDPATRVMASSYDWERPRLRIAGLGSTEERDRDGEYIHVGFFDASIPAFLKNPQMPWNHQYGYSQGKWLAVEPRPGVGYWFEGEVIDWGTDRSRENFGQVEEGVVKMLSVGFDGEYTEECGDRDVAGDWHWRVRGELIECSPCNVPSNRGSSFAVAKSMGLWIPEHVAARLLAKGASGAKDLPLAEESMAWDASAAGKRMVDLCGGMDDMDWARYGKGHFWSDPDALDQVGGYKLPFADVVDGDMVAVWRGVAAGMVALMGGRAPLAIPEADRRPVYDGMVGYYERFDKTPPEFKGDWPESLKAITWHNDEPDLFEEEEALDYLGRISGGVEWLRNRAEHWRKEGRAPSSRVLSAVASPLALGADMICKAGEVLSADNLACVTTARDSLQTVIDRHEAARSRRQPAETTETDSTEDKVADPLGEAFKGLADAKPFPTALELAAATILQGASSDGQD